MQTHQRNYEIGGRPPHSFWNKCHLGLRASTQLDLPKCLGTWNKKNPNHHYHHQYLYMLSILIFKMEQNLQDSVIVESKKQLICCSNLPESVMTRGNISTHKDKRHWGGLAASFWITPVWSINSSEKVKIPSLHFKSTINTLCVYFPRVLMLGVSVDRVMIINNITLKSQSKAEKNN